MKIIFLMLAGWVFTTTSFYTLQFQDTDGINRNMSTYEGKKILLVNIATGSSRVGQLTRLQQLQQQFADSLVIIGFPSNSFGKESRTDTEIKQFCQGQHGVSFPIAKKGMVKGAGIHPVFAWLTSSTQNGVINDSIRGDFQKMLISKSGQIIGIYSPNLDPLSPEIVNAIHDPNY